MNESLKDMGQPVLAIPVQSVIRSTSGKLVIHFATGEISLKA